MLLSCRNSVCGPGEGDAYTMAKPPTLWGGPYPPTHVYPWILQSRGLGYAAHLRPWGYPLWDDSQPQGTTLHRGTVTVAGSRAALRAGWEEQQQQQHGSPGGHLLGEQPTKLPGFLRVQL